MSLSFASVHGCFFENQSSNVLRPGMAQMQYSRSSHLGAQAFRKDVSTDPRSAALQCNKQHKRELERRIREQLLRAEPLGPSSYDTAWVAMVPARGSPRAPRFPRCVEWILQNQHGDGSWGLGGHLDAPSLGKDALSSTLACVLALRTWNVGDEHIRKGLRFIGNNSSCVTDDRCTDTPVGFNIIFPGMLGFAIDMGLELPLSQADVDVILRLRDMELKRDAGSMASGRKAFMAYVSEGLGSLQDWDQVMAYQRKNGSLFNSPSTTAAAAIHNCNNRALDYLDSLATKFGSSVPTVYPQNIHSHLCMVDTLEKIGISKQFVPEIKIILDMTYRCWLRNEEEVMLDMATCAMAFRLLRMHGYDVTSDGLAQFAEESSFHDSVPGHMNDTKTLGELYKASQVRILEEELILENIGSWSGKLLKEQLCSNKTSRTITPAEVEYTLKFPFYTTLERLEHKRNIEQFRTDGFHMLKSAYCHSRANEEILALAVDEFHSSQRVYQQELEFLKSWVEEVRLDQLKFARVMPLHALFSAASTMFPPELSDARIAWSQNCLLVTAVDDFFDVAGSREELENLVMLIEKWEAHSETGFYSEHVEILFCAVYNTSNQIGAKAALVQNRSVIDHIAELWLGTVRAMMAEAEWKRNMYVPPSMEEYMPVAEESFALGPIVPPSLYLVGPELSEDVIRSPEYIELLRHMNISGRLLNDLQTYKKESCEGTVNSVLLHALRGGVSSTSVEVGKGELRRAIEASTRELLRLVLREGSAVPRPCKELFWHMCKVTHLFYLEADAYFSPEEMMGAASAVVLEPLEVRVASCSDTP